MTGALAQTLGWLQFGISLVVVFAAAVGFFDALRRGEGQFDAVGRGSRVAWLIGLAMSALAVYLMGLASLFGLVGTVATIVYHVDQKPKLNGLY